MTTSAPRLELTATPRHFSGPGPDVLTGISLVLLIASLAVSAGLGGVFPSPFADQSTLANYFATNSDAVQAAAVLVFASAVALAVAAASFARHVRSIALTGGVASAGMLTLSALLMWVLSRPDIREQGPTVQALQYLAFLTGGVAHVVFLGLFIAGVAIPLRATRQLPRAVTAIGIVIAAIAGLATISLIWPQTAFLLPIARFPGLIWLVTAGYQLKGTSAHVTE